MDSENIIYRKTSESRKVRFSESKEFIDKHHSIETRKTRVSKIEKEKYYPFHEQKSYMNIDAIDKASEIDDDVFDSHSSDSNEHESDVSDRDERRKRKHLWKHKQHAQLTSHSSDEESIIHDNKTPTNSFENKNSNIENFLRKGTLEDENFMKKESLEDENFTKEGSLKGKNFISEGGRSEGSLEAGYSSELSSLYDNCSNHYRMLRKRTMSLLTDDEYEDVDDLKSIIEKELQKYQENIDSDIEIDPEYIYKQIVDGIEHEVPLGKIEEEIESLEKINNGISSRESIGPDICIKDQPSTATSVKSKSDTLDYPLKKKRKTKTDEENESISPSKYVEDSIICEVQSESYAEPTFKVQSPFRISQENEITSDSTVVKNNSELGQSLSTDKVSSDEFSNVRCVNETSDMDITAHKLIEPPVNELASTTNTDNNRSCQVSQTEKLLSTTENNRGDETIVSLDLNDQDFTIHSSSSLNHQDFTVHSSSSSHKLIEDEIINKIIKERKEKRAAEPTDTVHAKLSPILKLKQDVTSKLAQNTDSTKSTGLKISGSDSYQSITEDKYGTAVGNKTSIKYTGIQKYIDRSIKAKTSPQPNTKLLSEDTVKTIKQSGNSIIHPDLKTSLEMDPKHQKYNNNNNESVLKQNRRDSESKHVNGTVNIEYQKMQSDLMETVNEANVVKTQNEENSIKAADHTKQELQTSNGLKNRLPSHMKIDKDHEFTSSIERLRKYSANTDIANSVEALLSDIDICIAEHKVTERLDSTAESGGLKEHTSISYSDGELERSVQHMLSTIDAFIGEGEKENLTSKVITTESDVSGENYGNFTPYSLMRSRKEVQKNTLSSDHVVIDIDSFCVIELNGDVEGMDSFRTATKSQSQKIKKRFTREFVEDSIKTTEDERTVSINRSSGDETSASINHDSDSKIKNSDSEIKASINHSSDDDGSSYQSLNYMIIESQNTSINNTISEDVEPADRLDKQGQINYDSLDSISQTDFITREMPNNKSSCYDNTDVINISTASNKNILDNTPSNILNNKHSSTDDNISHETKNHTKTSTMEIDSQNYDHEKKDVILLKDYPATTYGLIKSESTANLKNITEQNTKNSLTRQSNQTVKTSHIVGNSNKNRLSNKSIEKQYSTENRYLKNQSDVFNIHTTEIKGSLHTSSNKNELQSDIKQLRVSQNNIDLCEWINVGENLSELSTVIHNIEEQNDVRVNSSETFRAKNEVNNVDLKVENNDIRVDSSKTFYPVNAQKEGNNVELKVEDNEIEVSSSETLSQVINHKENHVNDIRVDLSETLPPVKLQTEENNVVIIPLSETLPQVSNVSLREALSDQEYINFNQCPLDSNLDNINQGIVSRTNCRGFPAIITNDKDLEPQLIKSINCTNNFPNSSQNNIKKERKVLKLQAITNEQGNPVNLISYLTEHSDTLFTLKETKQNIVENKIETELVLSPISSMAGTEIKSLKIQGVIDDERVDSTDTINNEIIAIIHDDTTNDNTEDAEPKSRSESVSNEINVVFSSGKSPQRRIISFVFPGKNNPEFKRYASNMEIPCTSDSKSPEKHVSLLSLDDSELSSPLLRSSGSFLSVATTPEPKNNNEEKHWLYSVHNSNEKGTCQMSIQVIMDPQVSERIETETFEYEYLIKETESDGCVGEWVLVDCTNHEIQIFINLLRELLKRDKERNNNSLKDAKFCRIL